MITPEFDTYDEAMEWAQNELDEMCVDNHRFAYLDDLEAMVEYEIQANEGCCGSFDAEVFVAGRLATIGYNYGH